MDDWKLHCVILGVDENATLEEVRRAYRKLALELHPDKHANSPASTEEFRRLNESYRYVTASLRAGRRYRPAPGAASPAAPSIFEENTAPRLQRPHAREFRKPIKPKTYARIWLHSAWVCFLILTASMAYEHDWHTRLPASRGETAEHVTKAWCVVSSDSTSVQAPEMTEFWPQGKCQSRCQELAANHDVTCSWGGAAFREEKGKLPPNSESPLAAIDAKPKERIAGPGPGEFRRKEGPSEQASLGSICYMMVATPGNPVSNAIPNETAGSCAARCEREVLAHPLDRVIKCAFAGQELINHIPDPMASYLAANSETQEVQQGNSRLANCEVYGSRNGQRVQARAGLTSEPDCREYCDYEFKKQGKGTEISCAYKNESFFKRVIRQ